MPIENRQPPIKQVSRRSVLGAVAAVAATPALAETCHVGPPVHEKGPPVWRDMDQIELDASYDQSVYAPLLQQIIRRYASSSNEVRARLGSPKRFAYGPTAVEALELYPAKKPNAPFSFSSTVALGGPVKRRTTDFLPSFLSTPASITSRLILSRSTPRTATSVSWPTRYAARLLGLSKTPLVSRETRTACI
jgi:hypothetical protein